MRWSEPGSGVRLTPGALELVATMKAHGAFTALVSGGFTFFTSRVAALVGFDLHRSNTLLDDGATLAGPGRRADPRSLRQAGDVAGTGGAARSAAGGDVGDRRRGQRSGHAAGGRTGRRVPRQTDRRGGGAARVDHADLRALLFAQGYPASAFAVGRLSPRAAKPAGPGHDSSRLILNRHDATRGSARLGVLAGLVSGNGTYRTPS